MFCRYFPWQIPAVYDYRLEEAKMARGIAEGLVFIQRPRKFTEKNLLWIKRLLSFKKKIINFGNYVNSGRPGIRTFALLRQLDTAYARVKKTAPQNFHWSLTIYNPHILFDGIYGKPGFEPLAYCAWRLCPLNKIF
jgi:hypothetical protein